MKLNFMVSILKEDDWYIATCLENNVVSQGKTVEEALACLKEALELYFEDDEALNDISNTQKPFITTLEIAV